MLKIVRNNLYFLIPFMIWLVFGFWFYLISPKGVLVYLFDAHQSEFFNTFFVWATTLAEGGFIAFFICLLLIKRFGAAFILSISMIVTTVFVYYVKRYFDVPRPAAVLDTLHYIDGVDVHIVYSFPSGHTTAGFVIFTTLALFANQNWKKLGLFITACLVGLSRVYLAQHFLVDVIVGSIVGVSFSYGVYYLICRYKPFGFDRWEGRGLRDVMS